MVLDAARSAGEWYLLKDSGFRGEWMQEETPMRNKNWGRITTEAELLREAAKSLNFAGMETADADRAQALGLAQAEEMTAELRKPLADVSGKAGDMERNSPLFYGSGDNPTLF